MCEISRLSRQEMTKTLILGLITVTALAGCSHTYPVTFGGDKPRGDTVSVATLNRRLANRGVIIVRRDSTEYPVSGFTLRRDFCSFDGAGGRDSIATSDILAIRHVDYLSGAIGGFGLGVGIGFVGGVAVGGLAYAISHNREMAAVGIIPFLTAPLIGLCVGGANGTRTEYQLPAATPDSSQARTQADRTVRGKLLLLFPEVL